MHVSVQQASVLWMEVPTSDSVIFYCVNLGDLTPNIPKYKLFSQCFSFICLKTALSCAACFLIFQQTILEMAADKEHCGSHGKGCLLALRW